ncbi:hypothetical protein VTO73DRAFT_4507 [Trametes versicolor]
MAYASPVWFDCAPPGTLIAAFRLSPRPNQTPDPAAAFSHPLSMHEPSVKASTASSGTWNTRKACPVGAPCEADGSNRSASVCCAASKLAVFLLLVRLSPSCRTGGAGRHFLRSLRTAFAAAAAHRCGFVQPRAVLSASQSPHSHAAAARCLVGRFSLFATSRHSATVTTPWLALRHLAAGQFAVLLPASSPKWYQTGSAALRSLFGFARAFAKSASATKAHLGLEGPRSRPPSLVHRDIVPLSTRGFPPPHIKEATVLTLGSTPYFHIYDQPPSGEGWVPSPPSLQVSFDRFDYLPPRGRLLEVRPHPRAHSASSISSWRVLDLPCVQYVWRLGPRLVPRLEARRKAAWVLSLVFEALLFQTCKFTLQDSSGLSPVVFRSTIFLSHLANRRFVLSLAIARISHLKAWYFVCGFSVTASAGPSPLIFKEASLILAFVALRRARPSRGVASSSGSASASRLAPPPRDAGKRRADSAVRRAYPPSADDPAAGWLALPVGGSRLPPFSSRRSLGRGTAAWCSVLLGAPRRI